MQRWLAVAVWSVAGEVRIEAHHYTLVDFSSLGIPLAVVRVHWLRAVFRLIAIQRSLP